MKKFVLLILLLTIITSCLKSKNDAYNLSNKEFKNLTSEAAKGDAESANRLYLYYEYYLSNEEKGLYWLKKAAKNGHIIAQYNLGQRLLPNQKDLSLYWFKKAAAQGNSNALMYIKKFLNEEEINKFKKEALKGNAEAANNLYIFYRDIEEDFNKAKFWGNIAIKNGCTSPTADTRAMPTTTAATGPP